MPQLRRRGLGGLTTVKLGVKFTRPLTRTTGSRIATLDDTCGNLVQLAKLEWGESRRYVLQISRTSISFSVRMSA